MIKKKKQGLFLPPYRKEHIHEFKFYMMSKYRSTVDTSDVHKGGGAVIPSRGPIVEKHTLKCPPESQNAR